MRWYPAGTGQTPLDPDEARGLLHDAASRGELNELEQLNIAQALLWAQGPLHRGRLEEELMSPSGLCQLHSRMFGDVWRWAGSFRGTEKSIGVAPYEIAAELKTACDDFSFWVGEASWDPREAAARFHHRLVKVHPFTNGNGRHARVVADLFLSGRGAAALRWPADRTDDIEALRRADGRDYALLNTLLL